MIQVASPAGAGLPTGRLVARAVGAPTIPTSGIPVLVLHGPIPVRGALGLMPDGVIIRPLAPLVPSTRLRREEIVAIDVDSSQWYIGGRQVLSIRRSKGPSVRLMAPTVPGVSDGTETLARLLRAWWRGPLS